MAALSQIRYPNTIGGGYYDRKIGEGMKPKAALRALKRKISDTIYAHMINDARPSHCSGPGRATGERLCIQRGRLTPRTTSSSDKPLPGHTEAYDRPPDPSAP
jgi:transposase